MVPYSVRKILLPLDTGITLGANSYVSCVVKRLIQEEELAKCKGKSIYMLSAKGRVFICVRQPIGERIKVPPDM
jgi:hypothetical protein